MKPEKLFIVLFVCMGILLAMLYGIFELGGWEMGTCEKVFKIISIGLVVAAIIIVAVFACIAIGKTSVSKERTPVYFYDKELAEDANNLFIMRKRGVQIPQEIDTIIYMGDECLEKSDLEKAVSLKYLYFIGNEHKIEKALYTELAKKDINIICNSNTLTVIDDNKAFSVRTAQMQEVTEKPTSAKISGQIDISVPTK